MGRKAAKVREMIEAIAEDAWCSPPLLLEQRQELWACIWGAESTGELGSTFVVPARRRELRDAAESAGCWWTWTRTGEAMYLPLKVARSRFATDAQPPIGDRVVQSLEALRERLSGDDRMVVEQAIERLRGQH